MIIIVAASMVATMVPVSTSALPITAERSAPTRFQQMMNAGIHAVQKRLGLSKTTELKNVAVHRGPLPSSHFGQRISCGDITAEDHLSGTKAISFMTTVFWNSRLDKPFSFEPVIGSNTYYAQMIARSCTN